MEIVLWQWSTGVQVASALIIAVFFAALRRLMPHADLRWWVRAWAMNLAALGVTIVFWLLQPPAWSYPLLRGAYMGSKTGFVLLLVQGAWVMRHGGQAAMRTRMGGGLLAAVTLIGVVAVRSIDALGVAQHILIAVALGACGVVLARAPERAFGWLAAGFGLRSALALLEAGAYALHLAHAGGRGGERTLGLFLAVHSSFDTGAEWLLALGCVLALSSRAQATLERYNAELLEAHATLRALADRDALTGVGNRRTLRTAFAAAAAGPATLAFLDLDGFKAINDSLGHHVGDECLRRVAAALRECFRPADSVVRYAGDEFVVVAPGADPEQVARRLDAVRARLVAEGEGLPEVSFSVGIAALDPGADPDEVLRRADEAMYVAKSGRMHRLPIAV